MRIVLTLLLVLVVGLMSGQADQHENGNETEQEHRHDGEALDRLIAEMLLSIGELRGRVSGLEAALNSLRNGEGTCTWINVGYNKAHHHDGSPWCPSDSFIAQIDIDGCGSEDNCPIIGRVKCCEILP